jgi:hypothetical protein
VPAAIVEHTLHQYAASPNYQGKPASEHHFAALKRRLDRREPDYLGLTTIPYWKMLLAYGSDAGVRLSISSTALSVTNNYPGGLWEDYGYNWSGGS